MAAKKKKTIKRKKKKSFDVALLFREFFVVLLIFAIFGKNEGVNIFELCMFFLREWKLKTFACVRERVFQKKILDVIKE